MADPTVYAGDSDVLFHLEQQKKACQKAKLINGLVVGAVSAISSVIVTVLVMRRK
jgi:hypothetical protein